ncbi:MAG: hypothetical protein E6K56_00205 [Ignavibacteria bacterium]|nr:MAG: hypothetical protein E6K56_00205 [Ignavibacteria bacterium]
MASNPITPERDVGRRNIVPTGKTKECSSAGECSSADDTRGNRSDRAGWNGAADGAWGEIFNDEVVAAAILDRLLHHSYPFLISGKSFRLKNINK